MRTTLSISDPVLERAKRQARAHGVSLGAFVDRALQEYLTTSPRPETPVSLPTSPGGRPRPGIDPASNRSLYDALDTAEGEKA